MSNVSPQSFVPLQAVEPKTPRAIGAASVDEDVARRILTAVGSLKYGSVEVTVHEGRVVQIDRRERVRRDAGRK